MQELDAESQLRGVMITALGTGSIKKYEAKRIMSRLRGLAYSDRVKSTYASPAALSSMGIVVEMGKKNG